MLMETVAGQTELFQWKGKAPLIDSFPLMGSPIPLATILLVYLVAVLKVLPK